MPFEARRCFVYIQLPESLDVVTCARFEQQGEVGRFVYGRSYLSNPQAVELDKFELPLKSGVVETARNGGIFGALRDSSPDSWGRRIIERQLGRADLTEIDYLLNSPDDRAGALSFGMSERPPGPASAFNDILQLEALLAEARAIEEGREPATRRVLDLVNVGSSLGGARPKNVVEDHDGLWVAKFPSRTDRWNVVAAEAAMLALARECGVAAAEAKVKRAGGSDLLLVRRFDRRKVPGGYVRHRMVSALTVLRAEESDRSRWSYSLFADELRRWVEDPERDLQELFRRAVFNALICNTDDHPRNHALIAENRSWRLSPAYDLTPFPQVGLERDLAMAMGGSRRATRENLLREAPRFRLSREEASGHIDRMKATVASRWRPLFKEFGGTQRDMGLLESAFNHDGFEFRS